MKSNHLFLGILPILIGGISLSSFFGENETPQKTLVEGKQNIEVPQLGSSMDDQIQITLSTLPTQKQQENTTTNDTANDLAVPVDTQVAQEREAKRMLALERRREKMAERKRYKSARVEWRKSLNEARKEAKLSGDYSKYEAIKQQEPGKE